MVFFKMKGGFFMDKNVVVVGIGELMTDEIYKKTQESLFLLKKDGGGTVWNILCNLGAYNIPTIALGACGKDKDAKIAIQSLQKFNVNVDNVLKVFKKTKKIYVIIPEGDLEDESISMKLKSPFTGIKPEISYFDGWQNQIIIPKNINIIAVADNFRKANLEIIKMLQKYNHCNVVLDIGHVEFLNNISNQYIEGYINQVDFLQVNEHVMSEFIKRFNKNSFELYKLFNLKIMIITKGSRGVEFIWNEDNKVKCKQYDILNPAKIVDSCGAGDAFLSNFIKNYLTMVNNNQNIDAIFFERTFLKGIELTKKVVSSIGARGHLYNERVDENEFNGR